MIHVAPCDCELHVRIRELERAVKKEYDRAEYNAMAAAKNFDSGIRFGRSKPAPAIEGHEREED